MKNIIYIFIVLLFATACSDVLVEEPKAVSAESFYQTASELEAAVYAGYWPICYAVGANGGIWVLNLTQADIGLGRLSYSNMSAFQGLSSTNSSRSRNVWGRLYQGIRNANLVILNAPEATEATEAEIEQYVAEAKFLRAFSYFLLVRHFGGLPLRTEENMADLDVPRSSVDDVYQLILSDLETAEVELPPTQIMKGRADQYAAKAVLAHVYLQLERWGDARDKALEIINSTRYSLINVQEPDDFYQIFGPDVNGSSEEIFYLKYDGSENNLGSYIARFSHHPTSTEYFNTTGVFALYPDSVNTKVIADWDYNDLRKQFSLYPRDIGFGPTNVLYKKFINPTATGQQCANDWPAYRYPDIFFFYAEADCRLNGAPSADGMEKLNMIHRRGYGYDPNVASPVDFVLGDYDEEAFVDLLLNEALYEQIDEGKRFWNLVRTGKLGEVILENTGIVVDEKVYLWPIPSTEYDYNDAIDPVTDQNPGY